MKEKVNYGFPLSAIIIRMIILIFLLLLTIEFIIIQINPNFIVLIFLIILIMYVYYGIIIFKKKFYDYRIKIQKKMIELSDLKQNEIILDLGSGAGSLVVAYAKLLKYGKIYGIDRYDSKKNKKKIKITQFLKINYIGNNIRYALRNVKIEGVDHKCVFISQDFSEPLNFPNYYFDIILSSQSMYCLPRNKRIQTYKEINRVLKKDGKIIFFESKSYFGWNIYDLRNFFENIGYKTDIICKNEYKRKCIFYGRKK